MGHVHYEPIDPLIADRWRQGFGLVDQTRPSVMSFTLRAESANDELLLVPVGPESNVKCNETAPILRSAWPYVNQHTAGSVRRTREPRTYPELMQTHTGIGLLGHEMSPDWLGKMLCARQQSAAV